MPREEVDIRHMESRLEQSKTFLARKEIIYAELGKSIISMRHGIVRQQHELFNFKGSV